MSFTSGLAAAGFVLQATIPEAPSRYLYTCGVPLPTAAEVEEFVRSGWPAFEDRLPRSAGAAGEGPRFVRIENLSCHYLFATPTCRFTLTGRRAGGELVSALLETSFARDEHGRLAGEVVVTGPDPACGQAGMRR